MLCRLLPINGLHSGAGFSKIVLVEYHIFRPDIYNVLAKKYSNSQIYTRYLNEDDVLAAIVCVHVENHNLK